MPEVNVVIMTSVLLRGKFLGDKFSENAKFLGLWEKLSSAAFKTIGARMTSLKAEQAEEIIRKLELPEKQRKLMVRTVEIRLMLKMLWRKINVYNLLLKAHVIFMLLCIASES